MPRTRPCRLYTNIKRATNIQATDNKARASTHAATPARLQLLGLPAELRNQIWTLAVVHNNSVPLERKTSAGLSRWRKLPGITQTSAQTRAETLPIFLAQNAFRIHPKDHVILSGMVDFFGPLRQYVTELRRIEIFGCRGDIQKCFCEVKVGDSWEALRVAVSVDGQGEGVKEEMCKYTRCVAEKAELMRDEAVDSGAGSKNITAQDLLRLARIAACREV